MKGIWNARSLGRLAGIALVLVSYLALAQEFPTFKGDFARTGKNNAPNTSGPGTGVLTWYRPNFTDNVGKVQQIDNTYMAASTGMYAGGPDFVNLVGNWQKPDPTAEASSPFIPTDTANPQDGVTYAVSTTVTTGAGGTTQTLADTTGIMPGDNLHFVTANADATVSSVTNQTTVVLATSVSSTTGEVVNDTSARPDYVYSPCIASATGTDPRVPLNATDTLSTFTWLLRNPIPPYYESQNYAVYVYIPVGPTTVGGVNYQPQRYFVYEIDYAGGSFVDVVDTDRSGGGWVRLGGGGAPTDALFPSDGVNPIKVILYNTVPRDPSTGVLTTNPAVGSNDLDPTLPRPLVYADAVKAVPEIGSYAATPIVSSFAGPSGTEIRTIGALNLQSVRTVDGKLTTVHQGVVTSYDYNTGNRRWTFSPILESSFTFEEDNDNAADVMTTGSDFTLDPPATPTANNYLGANYYTAPVVATGGTVSSVVYNSKDTGGTNLLNPGSYDIYVWIPGDSNGISFAHNLVVNVYEGATVTPLTIDESTATGWTRVGTRSFLHDPANSNFLKFEITDSSADPTDIGRQAFADAVRFVGPSNLEIDSTPIQTTIPLRLAPNAAPVNTPVVIVADRNGKIYCLDAEGRGDGTTTVYWTYPSTRDPSIPTPPPGQPDTWLDPNLNAPDNIDGVNNQRIAIMPSGFSSTTSPALMQIGADDYLYIGSDNGRVYCIDTAGRGDFNTATRVPGTARRVWTYPDDYPAAVQPSSLGAITGSVAVATNTAGPTVFVPTTQGRLYALDATGSATTHTTTVLWQYPAAGVAPLGPIAMTPAVDFNQVFVGSESADLVSPGQFVALNWDTGALNWTLSGTQNPLSSFDGGPVTVDATTLGGGMTNTVFVANDNRGLYALDASTGAIDWESYEMTAPAKAPLTYTVMSVYDTSGAQNPAPVIVAPQSDGVVSVFDAQTSALTLTGGHRVSGYTTQSASMTSSVAVGWNFMYFGDNAGYLYALSNTAGSFPPGTTPPLGTVAGGNTPSAPDYSNAKLELITKNAYLQLRQGTMYYADALDPSNSLNRNPLALEWGETMYLLIYDFPYERAGTTTPPVVNVNISANGSTIRNIFTEAHLFPGVSDPPGSPNPPYYPDPDYPAFSPTNPHGGYAVIQFAFQWAGANAIPPGPTQLSIGFNTVDTNGAPINYPSAQTQTIYIANPLALVIPSPGGIAQSIGNTNVTSNPEALENGSASSPNLFATTGDITDGQSGDIQIGVVDRSEIALVHGGRGLTPVRVERNDLAWQGGGTPGAGQPLNAIDPVLFPNFEDLPTNIPNTSLDYPNIDADHVVVTKSLSGQAENPVDFGVTLFPPVASDGTSMTETNAQNRVLLQTPFDFTLNVPKYQPVNEKTALDSTATTVDGGYVGTYYVFVDAHGNGTLPRPSGFVQEDSVLPDPQGDPFRNFQLGGSVPPNEAITVNTPTVDLGSLAEGTGYTPAAPGPGNALFSPWTGAYEPLFKPFVVANEGNVNLLNLRLAKSTTSDDTTLDPWQILSPANEDLAYLSGTLDVWSDMDPGFAPTKDLTPDAPVILQKSRVGDHFSRQLSPNAVARVNPNLGVVADTPRFPTSTYPVGPPRVAVTVPFGFPVGTYTSILRVIEDTNQSGQVMSGGAYTMPGSNPGSMAQNLDPSTQALIETNSDPSLRIVAKVRESRTTSTSSPMTSPFIDNLVTGTETFRYSSMQPSGFRSPVGSLVSAIASNRPSWAPANPTSAVTNSQWRIFLSAVAGTDPNTATGTSPLRDLYAFAPDTTDGRWFQQSSASNNGFPDPSLDTAIWGSNYVAGSAKYGSPVFPAEGMLDPFRDVTNGMGASFPNALMAFVGDAQVSDGATVKNQSKIFVAPVTVDNTGSIGVGNIYAMTNDPDAEKGRPSIVETQNGFLLFYSATVGGRSSIYYVMPSGNAGASQYDGSYFTDSAAVNLGEGFESVSSPYVVGRRYEGATPPDPSQYSPNIVEMTFTGKLRGRPVSEVFYGRILLDKTDQTPAAIADLPVRTREPLEATQTPGIYLANGVRWDPASTVTLEVDNNGTYTDLEVAGTRQTERDTGIITFDTKLGGKAYLDPSMGSVRLSGATPLNSQTIVLTYQPRFLRISEGTTAGYAGANLAVDQRIIPDISYWRRGGDQSDVDDTDAVRTGRYMFIYGRAAAGAGQAARPVMKTLRYGIDLPLPVFTNPDGTTGPVTVSGLGGTPAGYYQIDPAKKKIYVTAFDEDRPITVSYEAADEGTGADLGQRTVTGTVGLITERTEELVQLDQATNEANVSMFLDPFDYMTPRRPGLVWLFWSSTRTGSPDVYMQTIAPKFTPIVKGSGQ